jgi:hypothetical protein
MKQHFRAQRHRRNEPLSQSLIRTMVGELLRDSLRDREIGRCRKLSKRPCFFEIMVGERGFEPPTPWSRSIAVQTPSAFSGVA